MVTVTVTDPRIELPDTMNSFASYLVSIMGGNAVRRRYSDFRWLYQRLQTEVPGAIIPIIPHTRTVMSGKKFKIEFMEERRRDLQEFFTAITQHKELCRAPSMTPFMMLEMGEDFDDGKWLIEQNLPSNWEDETLKLEPGNLFPAQPKSPQRGITTFFAKMRLSSGSQELVGTPDEGLVIALHDYIAEVCGHTKTLAKASDALVKSTLDAAHAHDEICEPISLWKTSYTHQKVNSERDSTQAAMVSMGKFSEEMAELYQKKHKEEEFLFSHTIHRLANTVSAFEIAMSQRKKVQVSYTHAHNKLIEKNSLMEKAQKGNKPEDVIYKLNEGIAKYNVIVETEKKQFEEITERFLRDAQKYKPRLTKLLNEAFLMFAKAQVAYIARINEACQRLIPDLEATTTTTPAPASPAKGPSLSAPPSE
mmetsp:Transcript_25409/g.55826  ORF Transcript_25409/g.55826 Transcript_25409/m.55826 type:complete len:421 (+) Transcript_25409:57-1319(+)|eukprot:CAMPEP_0201132084 /NCGR_PEP_ID=MMETSP0850-20130426/44722_1 /ASSEMBLY_ACC=CAM_ASM_000622 /TAXON_ID=183588 /ORGANISM="Pseudo-nitzschia fraudulenta, Strain WWA7" /LENGTH=420 /DNA_ID=CAMNT_0047402317 /DNA_START=36 /DNA_END=1298 /DNA_ORIENTATION=-